MAAPNKFKLDGGWAWVILVTSLLCNVIFDGIILCFGVFYVELLAYFNEGVSKTAWIGSTLTAVYLCTGPFASILANRFGCQAVTIAGSLLSTVGLVVSTFSPNMLTMIATYGILGGGGFGLMYVPTFVVLGQYFEKYLPVVTGLVTCGSGIGMFIFAPLSLKLIEFFSWKGALWIIAGISLNCCVLGATFREVPRKDDKSKKPKLLDWSLLKDPAFLVFWTSSFFICICFFMPFINLPEYGLRHGLSKSESAFLVSIMGIFNTAGRPVFGWLAGRAWTNSLLIYNGMCVVGGLATMAASHLTSYGQLAAYAAIYGVFVAAYVCLCPIILVELLGVEKLSNSFGFLGLARGIASLIGPPLAGWLFDITGNYTLAFAMTGASLALGGLICLPIHRISRCIQQEEKENQESSVTSISKQTEDAQENGIKKDSSDTNEDQYLDMEVTWL